MSDNKKQNFLQGTALLAMATAIVKIIGAIYKIPLNAIIGKQGFSYYSTAYEIYNVLLMISTAGLPVAMSRMISQANSLGHSNRIRRIYNTARAIFLTLGIAGSLPMAIANGQTYTHKITVPMPNTISKTANCSVVALLIDNFSGEIVNAAKAKLNEATTGLNTVANGTLAAEISAVAGAINVVAAQGTATVYTADGKLVAKAQVNGAATIAVAKGAYIVRVENGNDVVVKKVVL